MKIQNSKLLLGFLNNQSSYKKWKLLLCILTLQSFFVAQLTAQNYNVDNTEAYELLVPNLDVLHTNITYSKEDELTETVKYIDSDKHIIVGDFINSDILKKYIKTSDILTELDVSKINASDLYRDSNTPVIKKLEIHCDSFILNKSLWLPEMDILIHTRKIEFTNQSRLRTDPRPWKESKTATVAKNGLKAGDIEIITKYASNNIFLETNGSDGSGVQFPEVTFNSPKTIPSSVEAYWCYPPELSNCSNSYSLPKTDETTGATRHYIAIGYTNKRCGDKKVKFKSNDNTFKYKLNGKNIEIEDVLTGKERVEYTHRDISEGGKAGNISVHAENQSSYKYISIQGYHGPYYIPKKIAADDVKLSYNKDGDRIKELIVLRQQKSYWVGVGDNYIKSTRWFSPTCGSNFSFKNWIWKKLDFSEVNTSSGENSFRKFNKQYAGYSYSPSSKSTAKYNNSRSSTKFTSSIIYLKHKIYLEKNKIKDYQNVAKKDNSEKILSSISKINERLEELEGVLQNKFKNADDEDDRNFYKLKLNEAEQLKNTLGQASRNISVRYSDEFGNPLGYRPVLSFPAINDLVKTSIDEDLKLYIRANDAMKNIEDRQKLVKELPKLMESLGTKIQNSYDDLKENEEKLIELGKEGRSLAKEAESLQKKLKQKEEELLAKAKGDAATEKVCRIGGKVLAVGSACCATAAGGPTAGTITYAMVDKLSNAGLDKVYSPADNVKVTLQEVNILPFLNSVGKDTLRLIQRELDDLEYRKQNKLFGVFKNWKPDTTKNYVTSKLPESLEQYKNRRMELRAKIDTLNRINQRRNAMAAFALKGSQEIFSTFVNTAYLNTAIDRVMTKSPEYKEIGKDIKYNAYQNGKFAVRLRKELLNRGEITSRILNLSDQKQQLNNILADEEAYVDPLLASSMALTRTQSLERLKWMEYQLIKVYNYTTLEEYPDEVTNYRKLFSNELATSTEGEKIRRMKEEYKTSLKNIKQKIVSHVTTGHKRDLENDGDEYFGAKMYVNSKEALEAINDEKYYTIDLYNDFNDEIIQPDKNNIRIISFELENFELSRQLKGNERVEINITFDNKGILRKDDQFYLFVDDENSIEKWSWTLTEPTISTKQAKRSNATVNSEIYENMLKYLIGEEGKVGYNNLFTLKPAWSKIKLSATMQNIKSKNGPLEIMNLKFNVRRDYEQVVKKQKVCDFRIGTTDSDVRLVVKHDNVTDTLSHSQYNVIDQDKSFKLEAYSIDSSRVFSHWETQPNNLAQRAQGNILQFDVNIKYGRDVRVRPVFKTE